MCIRDSLLLSVSATADYPDFSDLVDEAAPAVVNVSVIKTISTQNRMSPFNRRQNPFDDFFNFPSPFEDEPRREQEREVRSGGSGFIISKDGYIVTNHHVVEDASQIFVSLNDRREFIAELIGSDKKSDVALLKISAKESLPFLDLGNSDDVNVGDWVLAIGSPYRLNFSVTAGIISAKARSVPGQGTSYIPFLQSDVAINPGNSGGPLFNLDGEVIGINAMIYSNRGGYMAIRCTLRNTYAHEIIEHFAFDPSCVFHPDHDPGQNRFKNRRRSKIIGGSYLFQVIQNGVTIFRAVDTESSDIGLSDRKNIVTHPGHGQIGQHFLI